jgi:hypothetical protein
VRLPYGLHDVTMNRFPANARRSVDEA